MGLIIANWFLCNKQNIKSICVAGSQFDDNRSRIRKYKNNYKEKSVFRADYLLINTTVHFGEKINSNCLAFGWM